MNQTPSTLTPDYNSALWSAQVLVECLQEAGDDVEAGFAAAEYIFSISDDHPRNNSNQFLSKEAIVEAAKNDEKYKELRDSIPEEERWKLDRAVGVLLSGGTIHHPSEAPELGINLQGEAVDPALAKYESDRASWEARTADRAERRKMANKAVRSFRSEAKPLDRVGSLLKKAGATRAEQRTIAKLRHDLGRNKIPPGKFDRLYEEVMECVHCRIDEEEAGDVEPTHPSTALSVDRRGVSHKDSGPEGGRFVHRGEEAGPGKVSKERQRKRQFAKRRGEVTEKVKGVAKDVGKRSLEVAKDVGGKASAAEHFASEWVGERVGGLPAALRIPLKALYYAGFGAFIAGQKMAKAVATEVGGEDYGSQVGTVLATIDNTAAIGAKVSALAGAHGPQDLALLIPVASATYLAYSSVRHPVATFNAAGKGVKAALQKMRGKKDGGAGEGQEPVDSESDPASQQRS